MNVFSQNNEQEVILKYFEGSDGKFLDIGANDGITLSNTRALLEYGWEGVCVEPSQEAFNRLVVSSSAYKCTSFNVAIGTHNGEVEFNEMGDHLGEGDVSLLSTVLTPEKKWSKVPFKKTKVSMWTYKELLKHSPIKEFNFISIDAEGMDWDILRQIDLSKTQMICLEHNGDIKTELRMRTYCTQFGLTKIMLKNAENIIYARP